MMVFGKKCPACGEQQLFPWSGAHGLAVLPLARCLLCAACRQPLVFLWFFSIGVENRRFARKQLPPNFLVRIPGGSQRYTRLRNISEGGLCFAQPYNAAPMRDRRLTLDLYNCNDGSSLEQLSAEIIATSEQLLDSNGRKTTVLSNCARFVNLSQAQRKVLASCLVQYGF